MLCDGLDDAALDELLIQLRDAYREAIVGGNVGEVAGEGRRISYTRANAKELKAELTAAVREKQRRDPNYEPFGALGVEF